MEIPLQKLKSWQKLKSPAGAKSLELKFICRISFWLNYFSTLKICTTNNYEEFYRRTWVTSNYNAARKSWKSNLIKDMSHIVNFQLLVGAPNEISSNQKFLTIRKFSCRKARQIPDQYYFLSRYVPAKSLELQNLYTRRKENWENKEKKKKRAVWKKSI